MSGAIEFTLDMSPEEQPPKPVEETAPVEQEAAVMEQDSAPEQEIIQETAETVIEETKDKPPAETEEQDLAEKQPESTLEEAEIPQQDDTNQKILEALGVLAQDQKSMSIFAQKIADDVRGMHKLYHNEYVGRLRDMQEELDKYHEIDREKVFDDILKEIAQIYCNNEMLLSMSEDTKVSKAIHNLFKDIEQFLDDHGVFIQKSAVGDKRSRFCQVAERIPTEDEGLHDTVAASRATGFSTEKRAIIKEVVDVYIYKEPAEPRKEEVAT